MYKLFFIFLTFIVIDLIYLNFSKNVYESAMNIRYDNVKIIPAIISWSIIVISYYYIVQEPLENIYLRSAMLAFAIYGVYNATNLAILTNYTTELAIRDTIWGISLFSVVTIIFSFV